MAVAIKRGNTLRIKVSQDMNDRITRLSEILSLPPSTLAALAVGTWVANQERALGAAERMVDAIGQQFGGEMSEELKKQIGLFSKENKVP
jgi:predicted transcriptional regulator